MDEWDVMFVSLSLSFSGSVGSMFQNICLDRGASEDFTEQTGLAQVLKVAAPAPRSPLPQLSVLDNIVNRFPRSRRLNMSLNIRRAPVLDTDAPLPDPNQLGPRHDERKHAHNSPLL